MHIGSYEVLRPLAGGGMSEALVARSPHGKLVVLKRPLKRDAELIARLRDEARIGSRVFHQHLVETVDAFEADGMPVVVVGYVEGPNLDTMRKLGRLPAAAAARVGCHVAEALTALHGALGDDGKPMRAVHRDVTGRNIVVTREGETVLIDLGIARSDEARAARTETGMIIGTIRYLAPELIDGLPPSAASDLWALACVIYEIAAGEPAFSGAPSEIALKITSHDPLSTEAGRTLDPRLRDVLAKLFAKDPARRVHEAHQASAMFRTLEDALGGGKAALGARAAACDSGESTAKFDADALLLGSSPSPSPPAAPAPFAAVPAPFAAPTSPTRPPPTSPAPPQPLSAAVSLELDRPVRAARPAEPLADRDDFYPKRKRDFSALTSMLGKVVVWAVVLAVLGGGYWYWTDQQARELAAEAAAKLERETELLREAMEDTAPTGCDGKGAAWAYDDAKGTTVVVDTIGQVPKKFRKTARCVHVAGAR